MPLPVRVAILDTGINPWHSHVGGVEGGVWVRAGSAGEAQILPGPHSDRLGHGTAVAGVIRWFAPRCKLYSIKVFTGTLSTTLPILLQGMQWALEEGIEVINLSVGTANPRHLSSFETFCQQAGKQGSIVIAAAEGRKRYPAVLPTVIGVSSDERCGEKELSYVEGDAVKFRALGRARPLPSLPPHKNFCGGSFAAARLTGLVAALLEEDPSADLHRLIAALISRSQ